MFVDAGRDSGGTLLFVHRRVRALFQLLAIPDGAFACVACHFEVLSQFKRVRRTGVFTQTAEHAAADVVREMGEFFASRRRIAFTAYDDEVLRAGKRAQIASNAQSLIAVRVVVQTRSAAISLGYLRALQWILFSVSLPRILVAEGTIHTRKEIEKQQTPEECLDRH